MKKMKESQKIYFLTTFDMVSGFRFGGLLIRPLFDYYIYSTMFS